MGFDVKTGLVVRGGESLPENLAVRKSICDLQDKMVEMFGEQENTDHVAPLNHYFCSGNYAREIFIPAGVCIIGKIHKHEHINVLSKGRCVVVTEEGREILEAPKTWISKPFIKRAVYAYEDVVWTTVHPTDAETVEEAEKSVIVDTFKELEEFKRGDA